MIHEITAEGLSYATPLEAIPVECTSDVAPLAGILGQDRAVSALRFGLAMEGFGFNVYVAGPPGSGKMTVLESFLEEHARRRPAPRDIAYRNNFDDPSRPLYVSLPPGRARELQQDLHALVDALRRDVPKAFESEQYGHQRGELVRTFERARGESMEAVSKRARDKDLGLSLTPSGVMIVPLRDGHPMDEATFAALSAEDRATYDRHRDEVADDIKSALKHVRELERATTEKLQEVDRSLGMFVVGGLMEDLAEKYADTPALAVYFDALRTNLLANLEPFRREATPEDGSVRDALLARYGLNVLVDNARREGAPVVVELNPTYHNLFGRVEKETQSGSVYTDFTMIRAGALHRANGGYLVLHAIDVLRDPFAWDGLKHALRGREIRIEEVAERLGFSTTRSLSPEPIPLDVKVVLVGPPILYAMLHAYDDDFRELFKVKADFDVSMPRDSTSTEGLLAFVAALCAKEKLRPLDRGACARLVDHAVRVAEDRERLSTLFGSLADVVREASHFAETASSEIVRREHLQRALDHRTYRAGLVEEHMRELIERKVLLIETRGTEIGQVNGLAVLSFGDHSFGRPSRITASVGPGAGGIVDIEREVALAGPIHSKGVLILTGYLVQTFAHDRPLALTAQLVFEQSYEGVEGDSASCAELCALLSALAELPVRQGIAVTGSINQHGAVQAIGGVNEKVEGFFGVCKAMGLTGDQGVVLPRANAAHLCLDEEVIAAVRAGKFHVYVIDTVRDAVELLTGVPAGERDARGRFPPGTVFARVDERLRSFARTLGIAADAKKKRAARKPRASKHRQSR
jgi:lon-related putative ATP-dependent protease